MPYKSLVIGCFIFLACLVQCKDDQTKEDCADDDVAETPTSLAGEKLISGEALVGWQGFTVMLALVLALFNLLNIAGWRVLGLDPVSGMSKKKNK